MNEEKLFDAMIRQTDKAQDGAIKEIENIPFERRWAFVKVCFFIVGIGGIFLSILAILIELGILE